MTLVIIKREGKRVSFSSDSRIIFGDAGHMDKGIKLFAVPFRIKEPASKREDLDKWAYQSQFDIAEGILHRVQGAQRGICQQLDYRNGAV